MLHNMIQCHEKYRLCKLVYYIISTHSVINTFKMANYFIGVKILFCMAGNCRIRFTSRASIASEHIVVTTLSDSQTFHYILYKWGT